MDVTPSREQVVLFAPRADMPVSDQPIFHSLLTFSRRQFVNPVLWLMTVGGVVLAVLPGRPIGLVFPAILAVAGAVNLVTHARRAGFLPRAEFTELSEARPRQITINELLRSGRTYAMRLPEGWLVTRLPAGDALVLARLRQLWVFGPAPGGALGFMITGGGAPRVARLAPEPPAGAEPVPEPAPPAEWPAPPKDDPTVRFAIDQRIRVSLYSVTMLVVLIGLVTVDTILEEGAESLTTNVVWWLVSGLLALLALVTISDIGRTRRARHSTRWGWTRVEAEEPNIVNGSQLTVRVRIDLPGSSLHLKVSGPPALVLSVHESKGLWLVGDLNPRRPMLAGIPEVPAVGRVRPIRQPR